MPKINIASGKRGYAITTNAGMNRNTEIFPFWNEPNWRQRTGLRIKAFFNKFKR